MSYTRPPKKYPDWDCVQCGQRKIFGSKDRCGKCGCYRSKGIPSYGASIRDSVREWREDRRETETVEMKRNESKPGDWKCSCGVNNFAKRDKCFKCDQPKKVEAPKGEVSPREEALREVSSPSGILEYFIKNGVRYRGVMEAHVVNLHSITEENMKNLANDVGEQTVVPILEYGDCTLYRGETGGHYYFNDVGTVVDLGTSIEDVVSYFRRGVKIVAGRDQKDTRACSVCMDRPLSILVKTCKHVSMCDVCCHALSACPMCRQPYDQTGIEKVFLSV